MTPPTAPRRALALAGVLVLVALAAPVTAQVPAPQVSVSLDLAGVRLDPGQATWVNGTVAYEDAVPGATANVQLAVSAPDGWSVTLDRQAVPVNAGGTAAFILLVEAPAHAVGDGAALVTATANTGAGRPPATATTELALAWVAPSLPPPPADLAPWIAGALVLTSAGALVVVILLARRRRHIAREAAERAAFLARETGITLEQASAPAPFGDRREVAVRVKVTNASDRPRVALVEVVGAAGGWHAAVNLPRRELAPGEVLLVTLIAQPPEGAPLGARTTVTLAAKPEEARERDERVTLDLEAPDARPSAAHMFGRREGVVPKALRR